MSAAIVGSLLVALPFLGFFAHVVIEDGWGALGFILALLAGSALATAVILSGVYLITEGWPS